MSKKMKGVALDSSPYGVFEDAKTRFKHQTLMHDYHDLHKEVEATRNRLETTKQRKMTVLAEVRFLRRRYNHLVKNKSPNPPQQRELVQPPNVETKPKSNTKGRRIHNKKETTVGNLPPISNRNRKRGEYMEKEAAPQISTPMFDLNQKGTLHRRKEATIHNLTSILELNQRERMYRGRETAFRSPMPVINNPKERIYSGNGAALRNPSPVFDLNQEESNLSGKRANLQSRAPIIDLNQISTEDEEFQDNRDSTRFEEPKMGLIRVGSDEPRNDIKLSVCRNVGDGSSSAGKRKISWQDPVALRV